MRTKNIDIVYLMEAEKQWKTVEVPKVKNAARSWSETLGDFPKECRLRFLKSEIKRIVTELNHQADAYVALTRTLTFKDMWIMGLYEDHAIPLEKKLRRYRAELTALISGTKGDITPEMIENARNYPIERLLEVDTRGFAKCINHDEKTPSMYCKKNFAHCFGCNYHGDVIEVYMKIHGVNFPQAIRSLNNV